MVINTLIKLLSFYKKRLSYKNPFPGEAQKEYKEWFLRNSRCFSRPWWAHVCFLFLTTGWMMAISGTWSWKTFSNISDPTRLSDAVASCLISGLSSTSSHRTTIFWDGFLGFSARLALVLCMEPLLLWKGTVPCKWEAEIAVRMEIDTSLWWMLQLSGFSSAGLIHFFGERGRRMGGKCRR